MDKHEATFMPSICGWINNHKIIALFLASMNLGGLLRRICKISRHFAAAKARGARIRYFDLFALAARDAAGPKLLVCVERTRERRVEDEALWDFMSRQPLAGEPTGPRAP